MKKHNLAAIGLAISLLTASVAIAHDASLHKGKPTEGEVVSLDGDKLKLMTSSGVKAVTTTKDTKVEIDDKPGKVEELKTGDHLSVFGTTLESGELVAKEIVRGSGSADEHGEHHVMGDEKGFPRHQENGR